MQPELQPLPIRGLMYRWGMDLAGPFPTSKRGNTYVLVCIEHFSKWIEVFPLLDKTAAEVTYHAMQLFSRYLAPAEVLTDGGGEFEKECHDLFTSLGIDHRVTSPNHPQANGLAERAVGIIKKSIKRYIYAASPDSDLDWDQYLPWIVMGYNVSPQASTKVSPYQALFAVPPITPSSIRERIECPVDFDDPDLTAKSILIRAEALRLSGPMAGHNLHIAQHRDTLRYARLRSKGYLPRIIHFFVGQYVYLSKLRMHDKPAGLDMAPRDLILRVLEVRASGVLLLVGRCGSTLVENAINCSPCHLQIQSPLTPTLSRPYKDHPCAICFMPHQENSMLLCDLCNRGFHLHCLNLLRIPNGKWYCQSCSLTNPLLASPQSTRNQATIGPPQLPLPLPLAIPPPVTPAQSDPIFDEAFWDDKIAKSLNGQRIKKAFPNDTQLFGGTVRYLGTRARPHAFQIRYDDGDSESMTLAEVLHYASL